MTTTIEIKPDFLQQKKHLLYINFSYHTALFINISEAIAQITEDDIFGWFAHCGLFI
jgi:hypothetical protein